MVKPGGQKARWVIGWGMMLALAAGSLGIGLVRVHAQEDLALITAVTDAREACYAAVDCPNLQDLENLFTGSARRTEINRANEVVLLDGPDALRADHQRVASSFTGRTLETIAMFGHGRNVVALQQNWDPGAAEPNPFISVFRIDGGQVAHWILIAP